MNALKLTALAGALLAALPAQAATVTFDDLTHTGEFVTANTFTSGGFLFTNDTAQDDRFVVWGANSGFNMDPGGATLANNWGNTVTTVTQIGGGTFDLFSIELGDVYNQAFGGDVQFVFAGANETVQIVSLANVSGPQLFTFNLTGLTSFSIQALTTQGGWVQFDNIVTSAVGVVPEPGTWALLILGFGAVGGAMRRRASTVRSAVSFA